MSWLGLKTSISLLSLEDELLSPTLECDEVPLILDGEFQLPSLVKNNVLASEEELVLKEMQVEKKHPELLVENVLVRVEDFNFPIDSLTFGMEEDRQVSSKERPSISTSQVWINAKHAERPCLLVRKK